MKASQHPSIAWGESIPPVPVDGIQNDKVDMFLTLFLYSRAAYVHKASTACPVIF